MLIRRAARSISILALGLLAACASPRAPMPQASNNNVDVPPNAGVYKIGNPYQIDNVWYYPAEQPDYDETGIASWYGPTFYGHSTANGEVYNGDLLTAAHKTLPMHSVVRVVNLRNGKSVIVRINDRGPYVRGRIIDLSTAAAQRIDMVNSGVISVRVEVLKRIDVMTKPNRKLKLNE